jgi:hypothetical protein
VGDIYTVLVDSLKALDPERPIREADLSSSSLNDDIPLTYFKRFTSVIARKLCDLGCNLRKQVMLDELVDGGPR